MTAERLRLGIFTTDDRLVIRGWDQWLADATGIASTKAVNRPLTELIPDLDARGILPVFERVLTRGTVEVLAPALHHYLVPCQPRNVVPGFARMQQHVTIGPLRDDGRTVGLIVTIEDVTWRVATERQMAAQVSAEDRPHPEERNSGPTAASVAHLLAQEDWLARREAVTALASQGGAVVASLIETLRTQHHNLDVLSSALDLLSVSDIDVVEPLTHLLADEDSNLRIHAALILGERRDRRAIRPLIARLDDADVNVQFHAVEALGRLQATEACEALLAIAERRDFFLAFPAIQALSRAGNATIAPRLVPLLTDDLLRTPAVEALGELGDEDVTEPLVQLLNTPGAPAEVIADALAGLHDRYENRYGAGDHIADLVRRSISPAGVQRLLDAVDRVASDRLRGLAKVLSWLDGQAVQRALTRLLGAGPVRAQVVEALVRHGAGVVTLLLGQLGAEDLEVRQAAAVALGRIGDRRATPALVQALRDPELTVPAAGALARIGDREAFEHLLPLLGAADPAVRQAAIAGLCSIGHPGLPLRIRALLTAASPQVRESALRIAGYFGYPSCVMDVLPRCRDEVEAVRRAAVDSLPFFEHPDVVPVLLDALADDSASVRAAAASALARVDCPPVDALTRAAADPDPWVRYAALRALATIRDPEVCPTVMEALRQDPAPQVRLAAIEAVGRLCAPGALHVLAPFAQSREPDLAQAAIRALGNTDDDGTLPFLERLLRSPEPWRRLAVIEALGSVRDARVADLLQWVAAAEDQPEVAAAAVKGLAGIALREDEHGRKAVRALIALTSEAARRETAIGAIIELPPQRLDAVAAGLQHASPLVRQAVVEALGRMKRPDASRALETALDDPEPAVRVAAIAELKRLGSRAARRKLLTLARTDPDASVRRAAVLAAARTNDGADAAGAQ